jgi:NTP pyrophosphatase (non-canonical NTP hydrolase)
MNIKEYQILAERTCPSLGSLELDLLHMDMGVNTEVAEAIDAIKKNIAYGKELDVINIQEEIADTCWYLVNKARLLNNVLTDFFIIGVKPYSFDKKKVAELLIEFLGHYNTKHYTIEKAIDRLLYISTGFELNFYNGLDNNINKLKVRFPNNFSTEKALNRDLISERIQLEK